MLGVFGRRVNLFMANMQAIDWREGVLEEADLQGADLRNANLSKAHLQDARMAGADLQEANLGGADLLDATGLTFDQVASAQVDDRTRLPLYLRD